jgi:hypothetical protein
LYKPRDSTVLQNLRRKGNTECSYLLNLKGISDSDSDSDYGQEWQKKKSFRKDREIYSSSDGFDYPWKQHVMPSSEVEYATEWYSESRDQEAS